MTIAETTTKKSPNPVDVHVGRRVRIRRVLAGMSQTALAEGLGLTFQQLQKYESGSNRISASRLWQISQILDVPIAWFFLGLGDDQEEDTEGLRSKRDTLELVRNIGRCPPDVRKQLRGLVKIVADSQPAVAAAAE